MTRRNANRAVRPAASQAPPTWPPTCTRCRFRGAPGDESTPYAACNGPDDQGRPDYPSHQRTPVGART